MKRAILFTAVAALVSGMAFAAGETAGQGAEEQMRRDDAATGEHQGMDVSVLKQRFNELDKNNDGHITYQEAQADPEFARYWNEHNLSKDQQIDMAEFARFEAEIETGVSTFQSGEQGLPATQHQEEVTGQDKQGASGASESDQERGSGSRY